MYQCEIFPNEVGRYEIHVLCNNEEIIGSPIHVHFEVPGDTSKVRIVDSKMVESSGRVQFIISTDGAGIGELSTAIENTKNN